MIWTLHSDEKLTKQNYLKKLREKKIIPIMSSKHRQPFKFQLEFSWIYRLSYDKFNAEATSAYDYWYFFRVFKKFKEFSVAIIKFDQILERL